MTAAAARPGRATRWEQQAHRGYGERFAQLIADEVDIDGEARLADTLVPRAATVLDAGCGMGRVAAAMRARGHAAYGIDLDAALLDQARSTFGELPVAQVRLDDVSPDSLAAQGFPTAYDLVVCVGNVMVFLAEGTERDVLRQLRSVTTPGGRMLVGFDTDGGPKGSRRYPAGEFNRDAEAAGWLVESQFASFDLRPRTSDDGGFLVTILTSAG